MHFLRFKYHRNVYYPQNNNNEIAYKWLFYSKFSMRSLLKNYHALDKKISHTICNKIDKTGSLSQISPLDKRHKGLCNFRCGNYIGPCAFYPAKHFWEHPCSPVQGYSNASKRSSVSPLRYCHTEA